MLPADAYAIRPATPADRPVLDELAALDGRPPLRGPILVADVGGLPTAALELDGGRVIADPYQDTDVLVSLLRAAAASARAPRSGARVHARLPRPVRARLVLRPRTA